MPKVLESRTPKFLVPFHDSTGFFYEIGSLDAFGSVPQQVGELPEMREYALTDGHSRMPGLLEEHHIEPFLAEQACREAARRTTTDNDDIRLSWNC